MNVVINQPTILLLFSGGLDSIAALHVLLTTQSLPVHCHHIRIENAENRADAEAIAVQAVRDYYPPGTFGYSESMMAFPKVNGTFLFDVDVTRFMAGYIAFKAQGNIVAIAHGHVKDDDRDPTLPQRLARATKILTAFTRTPLIEPVGHMTKAECIAMLPPELRKLAWSCRRPTYNPEPQACGKCKTCKQLKSCA